MPQVISRTAKCENCNGQGHGCNKCSNGVIEKIYDVQMDDK